MTEPLAFGLIGAGAIAQTYPSIFDGLEEAHVAAVADIRPEAAGSLAEALGCEAHDSWENLNDRVHLDAVIVCTPPSCARSPWPSTLRPHAS